MSRVAVLWNSANPAKVVDFDETQRAAQALRLTVSSIEVKMASDLVIVLIYRALTVLKGYREAV